LYYNSLLKISFSLFRSFFRTSAFSGIWWTWRQAEIKVEGEAREMARALHHCLFFRKIIGYGRRYAISLSGRSSSTPSCSPSSPIAWSLLSRSTCRKRIRPYLHNRSSPRRCTSSRSSASRRVSKLLPSASFFTAAHTCVTSGTWWTFSS